MSAKIVRKKLDKEIYDEYYLNDTIYFDLTDTGQKILDDFIKTGVGMLTMEDQEVYKNKINKKFIDLDTGKNKMKIVQFAAIFGQSIFDKVDDPYIKDNKFYIKRRISKNHE